MQKNPGGGGPGPIRVKPLKFQNYTLESNIKCANTIYTRF